MKSRTASAPLKTDRRRARGQSLVELCAGLVVGVPLILAGIDMGFIALGASINDSVCRDAARAAASGPPSSQSTSANRKVTPGQTPYQRVQAVIRKHSPSHLPLKVLDQADIVETVRDLPSTITGGAVDGDIAVKTTVSITPPFILRAYCPTGIELCSKHLMPFTYVVMPAKKAAI